MTNLCQHLNNIQHTTRPPVKYVNRRAPYCPSCNRNTSNLKTQSRKRQPKQLLCPHPWHKWYSLGESLNFLQENNHRKAADNLIQAYQESDSQTFQYRFYCLYMYGNILINYRGVQKPEDLVFLEKMERDHTEPLLDRIRASYLHALLLSCQREFDAVASRCTQLLAHCAKLESDEDYMNSEIIMALEDFDADIGDIRRDIHFTNDLSGSYLFETL
ncbi:hypothetical protein HDU76_010422 [Blyttiomyces sp. JEL0837]|nr:hypothetical protein HDU76_010422 [Blyttiomyces sp. JEL0837]